MIFHLYPIVTAAFQLIQLIKILQRGRKLFFQHTFGDISEYDILTYENDDTAMAAVGEVTEAAFTTAEPGDTIMEQ